MKSRDIDRYGLSLSFDPPKGGLSNHDNNIIRASNTSEMKINQ